MAAKKKETVGDRIKAVRLAWGWSQSKMAGALRCDQASISFWECGRQPAGTAITAISALFGCSAEALLTGKRFKAPAGPAHIPAFPVQEG